MDAKLCFGIYLIMASVMPYDVAAYSHSIGIREQLSELSNNDMSAVPQNENRHQVQLKFSDSASKFHSEFQPRRRRSTYTKDDALFSVIANLIGQGKRQAAYLIYSKATEIDGTAAFVNDYRTKLIKRIISDAYQQNQVAKIVDFITFELNDSTQVCLWLNALFETMKEKENLATMGALYLGRSVQRIRLLHVLTQNSDQEQECDLRLLADTISNTLIQPTEQLVTDFATSIVSDNNDQVIAAATDYPVAFDSIVHQLISIAVNNYNESDGHLAGRFRRKPFDFINRIPSLTTAIDALVFLNLTLRKSNINGMSKETILAHSIKKMEIKIKNANNLPFHYKGKFSELKNQIPGIKRLAGVPYVFIYKIDKTKEDSRKFMSSKKKKFDLKRKFAHYSDTTDEGSMWVLEPVNNIDQFRIKNQESGEYLYADDNISLDGFPNKRSVFTYNLSNGTDVNTDSLVWVLNSVNGTKSERFTIMNLHWKEFLDSQKATSSWDDDSDDDGEVYTLKDKVNPPESTQEWIISSGGPYERPEARLVCFFDSLATQNQGDRFSADKIDATLCTHLVYSRANIDDKTLVMKIGDEKIDIIDKGYENVLALKIKNPALKVMIAIGGQDIEENYSRLNSDPEKIKTKKRKKLRHL